MRYALILTIVGTLWTSSAFAQETRGYVEGAGAFTNVSGTKSGGSTGEIGFKVAKNLVIFGSVGNIRDAESSALMDTVNQTVTNLASQELAVTGTSKTPAWYSLAGARVQFPSHRPITPYVLGGIGFAKLNPSAHFTYDSGTTLSGNTANVGDDLTSDVVSNGLFTMPTSSTGLMLRTGGGVQVPMGKHLLGDVGYSWSRISADTPLHAQNVSFGLGIRF